MDLVVIPRWKSSGKLETCTGAQCVQVTLSILGQMCWVESLGEVVWISSNRWFLLAHVFCVSVYFRPPKMLVKILLGLHRKAAFYKGASHCAHLGPASGPRNVPSGREILGVLVSPLKTPWVPLVLGSSVYLLDCIQGGETLKTNIYCILMIYNLHITYIIYICMLLESASNKL